MMDLIGRLHLPLSSVDAVCFTICFCSHAHNLLEVRDGGARVDTHYISRELWKLPSIGEIKKTRMQAGLIQPRLLSSGERHSPSSWQTEQTRYLEQGTQDSMESLSKEDTGSAIRATLTSYSYDCGLDVYYLLQHQCSLLDKAPYLSHPVTPRRQLYPLRIIPREFGWQIEFFAKLSKRRYSGTMLILIDDIKSKEQDRLD